MAVASNGIGRAEYRASGQVKLVCPLDCPDTCQMVVDLADGRATKLRGDKTHRFTRGFLCQKMARFLEDRVYHPERLTYPLRRVGPKGSGRFERISWDEALSTIVERIRAELDSPEGPETILPYSYGGTLGLIQGSSLDRCFFHLIGASRLDRTICSTAGELGYTYTNGSGKLGADPYGVPQSRLIINWGSNTCHTNSHLWSLMVQARRDNGATLVAIDPYRSATARRSDWHLAPRPGTDAALALGIMHVLWRDELVDQDYLERYTVGAEALRQRVVDEYDPQRVSEITGLATDEIETLAQRYGTTRPSVIRVNYGMQRHGGGGMAMRTIACLPALVGAWRDWGGGALLSTSGTYDLDTSVLERPDLGPFARTINMNQLGLALEGRLPGPPVRLLVVYNCNPATVAPDQRLVRAGLSRDDLFTVVLEQFPTDTVDYADLVLPATTQAEHFDLHVSYGHHDVMLNRPAIEPIGECRSNADVFRALANRLDLPTELFPDDETLIRDALVGAGPRASGITWEQLCEHGSVRLNLPERFVPFAEGGFPTPSGRCELFSETMRDAGLDPLPTYIPPHEDPQTRPDLGARYPIQLISPPRASFLNSTFANSERHRQTAGDPTVDLAHADAEARGLNAGDWCRIYNDRGQFLARVQLDGAVKPGVAVAQGLYWGKLVPGGANVNQTTSAALSDFGGGATFFDNLVQIEPVAMEDLP